MAERLRRRGYGQATIANLMERLTRAGYLDDRKFAEVWVQSRSRSRPSGPALLRHELRRKGVAPEVVAEVVGREFDPATETALAVRALQRRRAGQQSSPDAEAKQRLWGFLRRRGFSGRACRDALVEVLGPSEDLQTTDDLEDDS